MRIATIVLAAGMGTRMKSSIPKVLHKIAGKPMLEHVLSSVDELSPEKNVVIIGETFFEYDGHSKSENITYVTQKDRLGTAHAVLHAKEALRGFDGKVLILFGDSPLITSDTLHRMVNTDSDVVVLGFTPDNPFGYGRLIVENGELVRIVEQNDATKEELLIKLSNSGVMAVDGRYLFDLLEKIDNKNAKEEYYLTDIIEIARNEGLVAKVVEGDELEVLGINSCVQLAEAENMLQQKLRRRAMENGTTLIAPETVFLSADTQFGRDVVIHPFVVMGQGVTIHDNAEIKSHSHLENCTVGEGATVGPFARIRPQANIGKNAKIGNFVEVKKSEIGEGAKVSHLSYIGDATVGRDANIGAGTITCNYDGENKFQTVIGDEAFIGSNTALVAPVKIGERATIGAGSTITKDVSDDALGVSRPKQKEVKGWKQ